MDTIDRQILAHLLADGRATYAAIGEVVGLSVAATKRRVDKMVEQDTIHGFSAVVDPDALGWRLAAHVQLFTNGAIPFERMQSDLTAIPEVIEAFTVAGPADTLLRVVAADAEQLERVIRRLRSLPYVQQTDTALLLSHLVRRPAGPSDLEVGDRGGG
ncbi:Lrp/AsnC family transcriptional regulator [Aeromicrobium sp. NPDC092404]|uniref:Lrp/AsnC family transcriptional regulator n=1 Tax=Aeromicrobium sp. NPDC092404 TaxID=3154976 RepID=UPI003415090E